MQQQVYLEVEGGAPGDSLTGFMQDDRAQQTALNSNVPRGGTKAIEILTQLDVCISGRHWRWSSTGAANWIDKDD